MPLIECTLIKGYDAEVRKRLAERVTDAACSSIGAALDLSLIHISEPTRRTPISYAVFCFGTLSGSWLDGSGFSGIRFVDRFELEGETIVSQMVWNDMAEMKPA